MNHQQRIWQTMTSGVAPMELQMRTVYTVQGQRPVALRSVLSINSVELGTLFPEQYRLVANRSGLAVRLAQWNLSQVLDWMQARQMPGREYRYISVAVPVEMLTDRQLEGFLRRRIRDGFSLADRLCLEFTPDLLLAEKTETVTALERLRAMGIQLSITEFGGEYCPVMRLNGLPMDRIVLDRSFIMSIQKNDEGTVKGLLAWIRAQGCETVLETSDENVIVKARRYAVDCYTADKGQKVSEVIGI